MKNKLIENKINEVMDECKENNIPIILTTYKQGIALGSNLDIMNLISTMTREFLKSGFEEGLLFGAFFQVILEKHLKGPNKNVPLETLKTWEKLKKELGIY